MDAKENTVLMVEAGKNRKGMITKSGMAAGFCKVCKSSFLSSGRRVVDGIGEKHRPLSVDRSQVGLHNTASSPASPTKETVERLSLFLSVHRRQNG